MSRPIPDSPAQPHEPGEVFLPDNAVVYVSHSPKDGITVNFGPGDHTVQRKVIGLNKALKMIEDLITAVREEMRCRQP
jgi:hypothetical protein